MKKLSTVLTTDAVFSDDGTKRYLLKKTWNKEKPSLAIIMLAPSEASDIALDTTTQLVLNNCVRLGYGSVSILNLFPTVNDFSLAYAEAEDPENTKAILDAAKAADLILYAPGVGKAKNKVFQAHQEHILRALAPHAGKLKCLCNEQGNAKFQHPLSPAVRIWHMAEFDISELIPEPAVPSNPVPKPKKAKEKTVL